MRVGNYATMLLVGLLSLALPVQAQTDSEAERLLYQTVTSMEGAIDDLAYASGFIERCTDVRVGPPKRAYLNNLVELFPAEMLWRWDIQWDIESLAGTLRASELGDGCSVEMRQVRQRHADGQDAARASLSYYGAYLDLLSDRAE